MNLPSDLQGFEREFATLKDRSSRDGSATGSSNLNDLKLLLETVRRAGENHEEDEYRSHLLTLAKNISEFIWKQTKENLVWTIYPFRIAPTPGENPSHPPPVSNKVANTDVVYDDVVNDDVPIPKKRWIRLMIGTGLAILTLILVWQRTNLWVTWHSWTSNASGLCSDLVLLGKRIDSHQLVITKEREAVTALLQLLLRKRMDWTNASHAWLIEQYLAFRKIDAITKCLELLRNRNRNGAFRMKADGTVLIRPIYANQAALALLSADAFHQTVDQRNLDRETVRQWILWYAHHQNRNGTICDFKGIDARTCTTFVGLGSSPTNALLTSWFAYLGGEKLIPIDNAVQCQTAGLFLVVVHRYYQATQDKEFLNSCEEAVHRSFDVINQQIDHRRDGLVFQVRPVGEAPPRYLEDNVDALAGLVAVTHLFELLGELELSERARVLAGAISERLPKFWQAENRLYAWALSLNPVGGYVPHVKIEQRDVAEKANILGVGWIQPTGTLRWAIIQGKLQELKWLPPDTESRMAWWVMAASNVDDEQSQKVWTQSTINTVRNFSPATSLERPADVILAFLEGTAWLELEFENSSP